MSGFPTRFSRSALGPVPEDTRPVRSARRELAASVGDMILHGVAAAGVMLPLAYVSFAMADQVGGVYANGTVTLRASGEAWDPDGLFVPTVTRSAAGVFSIEYPASVLDKDGNTIALSFSGALVTAYSSAASVVTSHQLDWTLRPMPLRVVDRAEAGGAATATDPTLLTLVLW